MIRKILRSIFSKMIGVNLDKLVSDTSDLKTATRYLVVDPAEAWLYINREERMDPSVGSIFDPARGSFHLERYAFAAKHLRGRAVLDAACGTGYGTSYLAKAGDNVDVLGLDIDATTIRYAKKKYELVNCRFKHCPADASGLPDGSIETIVSFETIEHVNDDAKLLQEYRRLLVADGILIISTPNQWPDSQFHARTYTYDSLVELLSCYFQIIAVYSQNSGTSGVTNKGQAAGFRPVTSKNAVTAECFVALCKKK